MKTFFKDMAERAIKTFAQAMIGALGAGATGLIGVDWGWLASSLEYRRVCNSGINSYFISKWDSGR